MALFEAKRPIQRLNCLPIARMEELRHANERIKAARDNFDRDYDAQIRKLGQRESMLTGRFGELIKKKHETAHASGE